eukprot:CAMPEP_0178420188 /NCGR_PEP_ID=MMETSP0689_2-20121128/26000_1 /TAXON_ID=160604 /ORGANISM="Amphidinium massartii, Strain CS-259" /LENGTH=307 /DNA_ID=CAMNT_0020041655 /DNA_START=39 /DNA_END=963 /DNA_ORIENTATION=+
MSSEDDVSASTCLPSQGECSDSPAQKAKPQWADIEDSDNEAEHGTSEEKTQQRWSDVPCDNEVQSSPEAKHGNDGWAVVGKKPKQAAKTDFKEATGKAAEASRRARDADPAGARSPGSKGQQYQQPQQQAPQQERDSGKQWGSTKASSNQEVKQWGRQGSLNSKQDASAWGAKATMSHQDSNKSWGGKANQMTSQDSGKAWGKVGGVSTSDSKWGKDAKSSSPNNAHSAGNDGWGRHDWSAVETTPTNRGSTQASWHSSKSSRKDDAWGRSRGGGGGGGSGGALPLEGVAAAVATAVRARLGWTLPG